MSANERTVYGEWESVYCCVWCQDELSHEERMHRRGVCPKCGNTSGCTIVDCAEIVRRKVTTLKPVCFGLFYWPKSWEWEYR